MSEMPVIFTPRGHAYFTDGVLAYAGRWTHHGPMESRLSQPWTLSELADLLHISPSHLLRLFKSSTGLPPMAYLARLRAETAAELLLHTSEPVTQIGRAVGWADQNYFARRFKAHFGLSATGYRSSFADSKRRLQTTWDDNP